jgi:hypothetical protein
VAVGVVVVEHAPLVVLGLVAKAVNKIEVKR